MLLSYIISLVKQPRRPSKSKMEEVNRYLQGAELQQRVREVKHRRQVSRNKWCCCRSSTVRGRRWTPPKWTRAGRCGGLLRGRLPNSDQG